MSRRADRADVGMIGIGVMGGNLAKNFASRGSVVAVHARDARKVAELVESEPSGSLVGAERPADLVAALRRPRRIVLLVPAGAPVDDVARELEPLLEAGDIVIDGGNSFYRDTMRREARYRGLGLEFVGMGVSGGAEGALRGPSMMLGGSAAAWEALRGLLEPIAAVSDLGPCAGRVGANGAGHYVKMVHNGIEYADMQAIAEVVDVLRRGQGMSAFQVAEVFAAWNDGPLESFLVELTARVMAVRDPEDPRGERALVDAVLDQAGQKGTGRWTVADAVERAVAVPTIAAALDARVLSSLKAERVAASRLIAGPAARPRAQSVTASTQSVAGALLAARLAAFAQGMALVGSASDEESWSIDRSELARLWRAGCILRARLLDDVREAYSGATPPANLLVAPIVTRTLAESLPALRLVVSDAARAGIPTPCLSASLAYVDSYRTADLPQNVTQAQRDAFGGHTYVRRDAPERRTVHSEWLRGGHGPYPP